MSAVAETGLFLDGLRCAGCVGRTERALREAPGVLDASVNYTTHRALVRFDSEAASLGSLVECVEELGYEATPFDPGVLERPARREARRALARLLVAAFLAGNVMWLAVALYTGHYEGMDPATRRTLRWLAVGLSLPAVTWCAIPFWTGAFSGLRRRELTLDVPILLGTVTAFGVSVVGTWTEAEHLFVDSAAMIVFLILLGRTLERGARARASGAVDRLASLTPRLALRRRPDGTLEEVAAETLAEGDCVVVPAGQAVPADGRLLGPATELDESFLTGESTPVARLPGDPVTGGSHNLLSEIEVHVSAPVGAGTLARLAALLERAQAQRPRVQRLADRVATVFAPAVLLLAGATAVGWSLAGAAPMDVALASAAVLIVACPCALGLATPAAVTAAIGRAAELGILVKSGEALERCAAVGAVVLDKTGTLTEGRLRVVEIVADPPGDDEAVLACAAQAEGNATHPVAAAIRDEAERQGVAPSEGSNADGWERQVAAGQGIEARDPAGSQPPLRAGSLAWLRSLGVAIPPEPAAKGAALAERGLSLVWVSRGVELLGVIGLADLPRGDAAQAVERLGRPGRPVWLLSGDHPAAVAQAARRAGVADARPEVSPEQKVAMVETLREEGHCVLAAGDGINDAALLGAADVGVAMAKGSDVTLHAADAVVRAPRLGAVADLVDLSRTAVARIRENLGFAVLYNVVAVPLAAFGILEPLHAAIAMSLSSLVVTGNSVRLLRWKAPA